MYKIAVMGDRDSVCGFSCIGIETVVCDENSASDSFISLLNNEYAIIYVTEAIAEVISEEISKVRNSVTPAVILIPGVRGNTGEGIKDINRSIERAVGSLI